MFNRLFGLLVVGAALMPAVAGAQVGNVNNATSVQTDFSGSRNARQERNVRQRIYEGEGGSPFPNNKAPLNINSSMGIQVRAACNNPTQRNNTFDQGGDRTLSFNPQVSVDVCHPGLGN